MENKRILLAHGSGGKLTHQLIDDLFFKYFDNEILRKKTDSAVFGLDSHQLAFTTDSFVVQPLFFPGGDIGKLSVAGTVNDLSVSGAKPLYISVSLIIEEGFLLSNLEKIITSIAEEARKVNVKIITGDTKVVEKGKCDGLFINTAGIGMIDQKYHAMMSEHQINPGDKIVMNGFMAEHAVAVLSARDGMDFETDITSDCASLSLLIDKLKSFTEFIKFMRDPTRGGVATVLCEITQIQDIGIEIDESALPIRESVRGFCEILGFDPLYLANEGKVIIIVDKNHYKKVLKEMKKDPLGKNSRVIGEVTTDHPGKVILRTQIGGKRLLNMLPGDQIPRIC